MGYSMYGTWECSRALRSMLVLFLFVVTAECEYANELHGAFYLRLLSLICFFPFSHSMPIYCRLFFVPMPVYISLSKKYHIYILFSATFRLSLYHIWWIKRFTESIDTRAFGCWIFMKLFLFVVVAFADALLVICLNSLSFAQSVFRAPSNKLFSYCKFSFRMKFLRNECGN